MRHLSFPIYAQAKDDESFLIFPKESSLGQLEMQDVQDNLYRAWDSKGSPCSIVWDKIDKKVSANLGSTEHVSFRIAVLRFLDKYQNIDFWQKSDKLIHYDIYCSPTLMADVLSRMEEATRVQET